MSALADSVHAAGAVLDVHLMIERPERHISEFAKAGADSITIHVEATPHVHYTLGAIREAGCGAGAAINPATSAGALDEVAPEILDLALCMSVNPGWGGQTFIDASLDKLERMWPGCWSTSCFEVDGVHRATATPCADAGATLFVAGSAVFGSGDPAAEYAALVAATGSV